MSTPKLMIVTWYGLRESLQLGADALSRLDYDVVEYPLFRFMCDQHDKKPTWLSDFSQAIKTTAPKIILWWFFDIDPADFKLIRTANPSVLHILFNWDDPFKWQIQYEPQRGRAQYWDIAFTCCKSSCDDYLAAGSKEAFVLYPGVNVVAEVDVPTVDSTFDCDVSFILTNLYMGPQYANQLLQRKELVDLIAREPSIKFNIYGPSELAIFYPNHYKGTVRYENQAEIFRKSRINISTHVVGNRDGYLNERVSLIMGSGGLLLVDPVAGIREALKQPIESDMENAKFLLMDTKYPVEQILDILEDMRRRPQHYADIRKRAWLYAKENLSYDCWASAIHAQVGKHLLDQEWYAAEVGTEFISRREAVEHWLSVGYKNGYIPCFLEVPKLFRYTNYLADFELESKGFTRERAWVHYLRAGQPKVWLYCPQPGSTPIVDQANFEKPILHPIDKAQLIADFAAIHNSQIGQLSGKLQDLHDSVNKAGGQYVPFDSLLKSFIAQLE